MQSQGHVVLPPPPIGNTRQWAMATTDVSDIIVSWCFWYYSILSAENSGKPLGLGRSGFARWGSSQCSPSPLAGGEGIAAPSPRTSTPLSAFGIIKHVGLVKLCVIGTQLDCHPKGGQITNIIDKQNKQNRAKDAALNRHHLLLNKVQKMSYRS